MKLQQKVVKTKAEFDINSTRGKAKAEFVSVMEVLKNADKELFRDALQIFVREDILDMMDEIHMLIDEDEEENDD